MKLKILKIKIKNQTKNYRQLKKIYRNKLMKQSNLYIIKVHINQKFNKLFLINKKQLIIMMP